MTKLVPNPLFTTPYRHTNRDENLTMAAQMGAHISLTAITVFCLWFFLWGENPYVFIPAMFGTILSPIGFGFIPSVKIDFKGRHLGQGKQLELCLASNFPYSELYTKLENFAHRFPRVAGEMEQVLSDYVEIDNALAEGAESDELEALRREYFTEMNNVIDVTEREAALILEKENEPKVLQEKLEARSRGEAVAELIDKTPLISLREATAARKAALEELNELQ